MHTRTLIAAGVPLPVTEDGELIGVVSCDEPIVYEDGRRVAPERLVLRSRPDVFARWKADRTLVFEAPQPGFHL